MAQRKGISTGTTAQRSIEEQGKLRFNTTTSLLEYYDGTSWKAIDAPPVVSSVSPSTFVSDGSSTPSITITGSGFSSTIDSVKFIGNDGTEYTSGTVTRDSSTQITAVINSTTLGAGQEPFDVQVTADSGLSAKLDNQIQIAHNVEIGKNTVIAAQTGVAGSTKIGSHCQIGGQVGISGHLTIGNRVGIQAKSGILKNIKDDAKVMGYPAFDYTAFNKAYVHFRNLHSHITDLQTLKKI